MRNILITMVMILFCLGCEKEHPFLGKKKNPVGADCVQIEASWSNGILTIDLKGDSLKHNYIGCDENHDLEMEIFINNERINDQSKIKCTDSYSRITINHPFPVSDTVVTAGEIVIKLSASLSQEEIRKFKICKKEIKASFCYLNEITSLKIDSIMPKNAKKDAIVTLNGNFYSKNISDYQVSFFGETKAHIESITSNEMKIKVPEKPVEASLVTKIKVIYRPNMTCNDSVITGDSFLYEYTYSQSLELSIGSLSYGCNDCGILSECNCNNKDLNTIIDIAIHNDLIYALDDSSRIWSLTRNGDFQATLVGGCGIIGICNVVEGSVASALCRLSLERNGKAITFNHKEKNIEVYISSSKDKSCSYLHKYSEIDQKLNCINQKYFVSECENTPDIPPDTKLIQIKDIETDNQNRLFVVDDTGGIRDSSILYLFDLNEGSITSGIEIRGLKRVIYDYHTNSIYTLSVIGDLSVVNQICVINNELKRINTKKYDDLESNDIASDHKGNLYLCTLEGVVALNIPNTPVIANITSVFVDDLLLEFNSSTNSLFFYKNPSSIYEIELN